MVSISLVLVASVILVIPGSENEPIRTCAPLEVYTAVSIDRMEYWYKGSLAFPVDGVVECALREIALFKLVHPNAHSTPLYDQISRLAQHGGSPAVRYKATLVTLVFDHPEMFGASMRRDYLNDELLFTSISDRLRDSVLATVSR